MLCPLCMPYTPDSLFSVFCDTGYLELEHDASSQAVQGIPGWLSP